jgi:hypothetical protein
MSSTWGLRSLVAATCLAALLALLSASAASAKIYLRGLEGRTVRGGQVVHVFVPGCDGNPACKRLRGMQIYITPVVRRVWANGVDPRPPWPVGRLDADAGLVSRVPRIAQGRYYLMAWAGRPLFKTPHFVPATNAFTVRR